MPIYSQESLEKLRERIDLTEVLTSHIELKKTGASYKALCPFHDEKTPSFTVQKGDTHYHCFGCGAHGDAIQFLMSYLKLSFSDAVEALAEKFQVPLQTVDRREEKGVDKTLLREALDAASQFFHSYLIDTEEGKNALAYLIKRGISLEFIRRFQIGLAPKENGLVRKVLLSKRLDDVVLQTCGLIREGKRDFFQERITFPIRNGMGSIIGFSARKYKEETFGGKYINTPETPLFKKSRTLFGLNYSRERIAKERKAIIVEGQIDCLKMIEAGFNLTVASLGTAFGEEHVRELATLGTNKVFLLFDGDEAGRQASSKVGNLFQKVGIEVKVVSLPNGKDPDSFLFEKGRDNLKELIQKGSDYLTFQVAFLSKGCDLQTPSGKAELIRKISTQIKSWEDPVMIHESLRKVAELTFVPEEVVGVGSIPFQFKPRSDEIVDFDPHRILELDLLRWLLLVGIEKKEIAALCQKYLNPSHFFVPICRKIFETYMSAFEKGASCDLLTLMTEIQGDEGEKTMKEIMNKKINRERAEKHCLETIQKLLDRKWLLEREEIKKKIVSKETNEEEKLHLIKNFDQLGSKRPQV